MRINKMRFGMKSSVAAVALVAALSFGAPIAWADNAASAGADSGANTSVSAAGVKTNTSGAEQTKAASAQSTQNTEASSKAATGEKGGTPAPALNPGWNKLADGSWVYCNQSKKTVSGWQKIGGTWYWFDANDENRMVASKIQLIEGKKYAFRSSGAMATGWIKMGADWYYASGSGVLSTGWLSDGAWYYLDPADNGKMVEGCVKAVDGKRYAFRSSGAMVSGWGMVGSDWYYANASGALRSGWVKDGSWYYLDPADGGKMVSNTSKVIDGSRYAFNASGAMATGWMKAGSDWYYASNSGALRTGWVQSGSTWYYLDPKNDGRMAANCIMTIGGKRYGFAASGAMGASGLVTVSGQTYYAGASGALESGWKTVKGSKYWFDSSNEGAAAKGLKTISGKQYYFSTKSCALYVQCWAPLGGNKAGWAGSDGAITGSYDCAPSGLPYLTDDKGNLLVGWKTFNGVRFHAGAVNPGEIDTNRWIVDGGKKYWLDENGRTTTGWQKFDGKWYFFDKDGAATIGWVKDKDTFYYTDSNGVMLTGWQKIGSDWYYFKSSGAMATWWLTINGRDYYFDKSGKWVDLASQLLAKGMYRSSATSWQIVVDTYNCCVAVLHGSYGNWTVHKFWVCSPGAPYSPTVKGEFTVGAKGLSFGHGYTCWYYTQFCGNYLFHSVKYAPGSMSSYVDERLGINISGGCVRLQIDNAKWIWDNIPGGTKVYVY